MNGALLLVTPWDKVHFTRQDRVLRIYYRCCPYCEVWKECIRKGGRTLGTFKALFDDLRTRLDVDVIEVFFFTARRNRPVPIFTVKDEDLQKPWEEVNRNICEDYPDFPGVKWLGWDADATG